MIEAAEHLGVQSLARLSDHDLADEIRSRKRLYEHWVGVYWKEFIPFAHEMRLFGQFYNDTVQPQDPFEFMDLLASSGLVSIERNRLLGEIAQHIRQNPELMSCLKSGIPYTDPEFNRLMDRFVGKFGITSRPMEGTTDPSYDKNAIIPILLQMAETASVEVNILLKNREKLTSQFFSRVGERQSEMAHEILDLGRTSYRMRDDDNIYLGRIEKQMNAALEEGQKRIDKRGKGPAELLEAADLIETLKNPGHIPTKIRNAETVSTARSVKARQMVGQPAGPGIARGKARVVLNRTDLLKFEKGEILICDALDPNMTFVVPLSTGIVERRGGMLIHGAII